MKEETQSRRAFLASFVKPAKAAADATAATPCTVTQGVASVVASAAGSAAAASAAAMTQRTGAHGEKISLLGYGAMRMPFVPGKANEVYDEEMLARHVDALLAGGVNYFDASPVYCQGKCEELLARALARHPRACYRIATKLSNFSDASPEASKRLYARSQELFGRGAGIDFYLLHSIGNGGMAGFERRYVANGMIDFMLAERAAGRIKNLGFSFHGPVEVFDHALSLHDKVHWDFVQIQMNYLDWKHAKDVNPRNPNASYLYGECAKRDIPVVVMEPLLGGRLAKFNYAAAARLAPFDPEETMAGWALRFAATHPRVLTVLSGMSALDHIEQNIRTFSPLRPLDDERLAALEDVACAVLADRTIPCNACDYCMPCPYGLDIPALFGAWNAALVEKRVPDDPADADYEAKRARFLSDYERAVPNRLRRADHCTGCGRCVPHCPQSIDVTREMALLARRVECIRLRKGFAS